MVNSIDSPPCRTAKLRPRLRNYCVRILNQNEPRSEAEISGFSTASIKPQRYD